MMNKEELKIKLLATEIFINNRYLDQYCDLIIQNLEQSYIKYQTQKHHILPKCYFKLNNIQVDNSKENLVNLLYKDHILVHYYLCLCTEGILQYKLANAFFYLVNRKWKYDEFDPETDLNRYQELYEQYILNLKNDKDRWVKTAEILRSHNHSQFYTKEVRENISKNMKARKIIRKNKILCIETQQIFNSAVLAKKWLIENSLKGDIGKCLHEKSPIFTAGGYHWAYLKDIEYIESLKEFVGKKRQLVQNRSRKQKRVLCIETQETFNSVKEASNKYGATIYNSLKNMNKTDKNNLHWIYLEDKIENI